MTAAAALVALTAVAARFIKEHISPRHTAELGWLPTVHPAPAAAACLAIDMSDCAGGCGTPSGGCKRFAPWPAIIGQIDAVDF